MNAEKPSPPDPDVVETLVEKVSDPFTTIKAAAIEAGLDPVKAQKVVKKLLRENQPDIHERKAVKTADLLRLIEERVQWTLEVMDPELFARMAAGDKGKDLSIMLGVLMDKRQLLRGEPTHIIGIEERGKLNEVAGLFLNEMKRRGMLADDRGDVIDVTPRDVEPKLKIGRKGYENMRKAHELDVMRETGELEALEE